MGGYQQPAVQGISSRCKAMPSPAWRSPMGNPNVGVSYPAGVYPRGIPGPAEPVALDVALIRQVNGSNGKQVALMRDGETLKGGGRMATASKLLVVRTNCECFVYVISIDGSGGRSRFPCGQRPGEQSTQARWNRPFPMDPIGSRSISLRASKPSSSSPLLRDGRIWRESRATGRSTTSGRSGCPQVESRPVIPNGFGKTQSGQAAPGAGRRAARLCR